jgi:ribosomal protein S12 methylthiotransferase
MKKKITIISLGCSKNLVDSENLSTQVQADGWEVEFDNFISDSKTVVINTCGFIHDAKQESINTILSFIDKKKSGKIENLFVMGCLSERYKKDLEKEIPEVDSYFGVNHLPDILKKLKIDYRKELLGERKISTPSHYAYLKISEGCNRTCSFCAIPLIRGKQISIPIEILLKQAQNLAQQGVKELILIAQDLSSYGYDLYKEYKLADLLEELVKVQGIEWIRLHYIYPTNLQKKVIELMKNEPKICKYIDIPIQHISQNVLKNMRRGHQSSTIRNLIKRFKTEIPEIAIRTTLLVGFPGEEEVDFQELMQFVSQSKFDRLGVFTYSEEEDTFGAKKFKDTISQEIKDLRAEKIMQLQQTISFELNQAKIGKSFKTIIDRKENSYFVGRTEFDSPEVDNEIIIENSDFEIEIGQFYKVEIVKAEEFDLYAKIIEKL